MGWDWLAVLVFAAFAALYFLGRLQGNYPVVILSGDAGNIASYAAATDHPDWFLNDPILGASNNFGIYATVHIPLIRLLENLTGDYGLAYAWLVLPQTFLQLLGFYVFGRVLFKNRFWAFLLAFLTAMPVLEIGLGENWGVLQDALTRVTFQSLLPFVLALVLVWKDKPKRWPWLMVFAGLLVYAHPISTPAWGLAIWFSLWLFQPRSWTWKRRLLVMLGLGLVFLATLTPFALNYLHYRGRDQAADYAQVMTILQTYMPANLLNVPAALGNFLWTSTRSLLLPLALTGLAATWILKKEERTPVKVVLLWMAGIFLTSIVIPFGERLVEARFQMLPLETELTRGIRYFVPLLLLFWLWPLAELTQRLEKPRVRLAVMALGLALFGFWGGTHRPAVGDMLDTLACFTRGQIVCSAERPLEVVIQTLRTETQPGEGVLFFVEDPAYISQTLSVRYEALRPLVYTERDAGTLSYADRAALPAWLETTNQWQSLRSMTDPAARLEGLVSLSASLEADYLVIDFPVPAEALTDLPVTVLLQNDGYSLFRLP